MTRVHGREYPGRPIMHEISDHLGIPRFSTATGSTVRRDFLEAVATAIGVEPAGLGKEALVEKIWEKTCGSAMPADRLSRGGTITNRVLSEIRDGLRSHTLASNPQRGRESHMAQPEDTEAGRSELEQLIAEHLSTLSRSAAHPTHFERAPREFPAARVDFSTNQWIDAVIEVEDWLHLNRELEKGSGPGPSLVSLAEGLGMSDPSAAVSGALDPTLSTGALTRLQEQCTKAVNIQERFLDSFEEVGDLAAATEMWRAEWDGVEEEDERSGGPITAKTAVWPIMEFSSRAQKGQLELSPSYQRDDVWPTGDSQLLIESILRGIPLPSVILLEPEDKKNSSYEVVDGKQRLTSILRFIGRHPRALEHVEAADEQYPDHDLKRLYTEDYPKFRREWKKATGETLTATLEKKYYFPFRLRPSSDAMTGGLADLQGKYFTQIREKYVEIASTTEDVATLFEMTSDYKVPVIIYTKASPRQIHEVFNLYNKQGKHLNAEEIRNALFHRYDLMRGFLVAAGDSPFKNGVAPFLEPVWNDVSRIRYQLDDFNFGTQRYKRSKILAWTASMVVLDSHDGYKPIRRSTARQTNALLERVEHDQFDALRDTGRLQEMLVLLSRATDSHSSISWAWHPKFKDGSAGTKWQELQLVATLMGFAAAGAVLGDALETRSRDAASQFEMETAEVTRDPSSLWKRPAKTQTQTQLRYQAQVALRTLEILGVDASEADKVLRDRFGGSTVHGWMLMAR